MIFTVRKYNMAKADLHVHTCFSAHPSEWFLQRLGTRESYTCPEDVYATAKQQGMSFVTITDHNDITASLRLMEKHPEDVFTGTEVTTYFPEDGCKIHVLVWGLDQAQFRIIDKIREDIFSLREYLKEQNLAHSVAHATFSINKKLTLGHIERLFLLFDYFEGQNGCRTQTSNDILTTAAMELTPNTIDMLYDKHKIEPFSETPWHKGLTGGSDDHSGLFIARTYTEIKSNPATTEQFLDQLRMKTSDPGGRHNDYRGFALSLYKIAYEFSRSKNTNPVSGSFMSTLHSVLFEGKSSGLRGKLALKKWRFVSRPERRALIDHISTLIQDFEDAHGQHMEDKYEQMYDHLALVADDLLKESLTGIKKHLSAGNLPGVVRNISGMVPTLFMSFPLFTSMNVLHDSRKLLQEVEQRFGVHAWPNRSRCLWFTDTLSDLNGVSETIQKIGRLCGERSIDLQIVSCVDPDRRDQLPPNVLELPTIGEYSASFFKTFALRIPSLLNSLKLVYDSRPDEIIVSTPGPVGALGILVAKLLHLPCRGIYHTDFTMYASTILEDQAVAGFVGEAVRWFYSWCDTVRVPTHEYKSILEARGYDRTKLRIFRRAVDSSTFYPRPDSRDTLTTRRGIPKGYNLLYAGRISKEKNVDFLFTLHEEILKDCPEVNLVLCGDGPQYEEYHNRFGSRERVCFLGRLDRNELPGIYSAADLFLFPSTTDTFGMVVLEAQACGLPALVTDCGGPKEIVVDSETGFVIPAGDSASWVRKIRYMISLSRNYPERLLEMRYRTCEMARTQYAWDDALSDLFGSRRTIEESAPKEYRTGTTPRNKIKA